MLLIFNWKGEEEEEERSSNSQKFQIGKEEEE